MFEKNECRKQIKAAEAAAERARRAQAKKDNNGGNEGV